MKSTDSISTPN